MQQQILHRVNLKHGLNLLAWTVWEISQKNNNCNQVLSSLLCVSTVENESSGGDAIFSKHTREQEESDSNPRASGGDFQETWTFWGDNVSLPQLLKILTAATL